MLVKQLVKTINAEPMGVASLVALLFASLFAGFLGLIPNRKFGQTSENATAAFIAA